MSETRQDAPTTVAARRAAIEDRLNQMPAVEEHVVLVEDGQLKGRVLLPTDDVVQAVSKLLRPYAVTLTPVFSYRPTGPIDSRAARLIDLR